MKKPKFTKDQLGNLSKDQLIQMVLSMDEKIVSYEEQLDALRRQKFGSKTEQTSSLQLSLFNEIEDTVDHASEEELEEETVVVKKKKRKKKKALDFSKLRHEQIHHNLEFDTCPDCGSKLVELKPEVKEILKYKPAEYYIEEHIIHHYVCKECTEKELKMKVFTPSDVPTRLIEGSLASSSVVAGIAYNKFILDIPLYRQEQSLFTNGVYIPRQNMSNWLMRCSEDYLEMLFEAMLKDLRELEVIHMDETTLLVIEDKKEGRQKDYEWLAMSGKFEEKQMALFLFKQSREHANVVEILGENNHSIIHSDGYEAYHKGIGKMTVGCMAHVRRKFDEAEKCSECSKEIKKLETAEERKAYLKQNPGYENILETLKMINQLFSIETKLQDANATPEEIYKTRQEESKPIFDELFEHLEKLEGQYSKQGKMGRAIAYALNEKKYVENYLKDGRTEISNNRAERFIKPFTTARKNFLFSNTRSGAKCSSIYFSLLQSAKMNGLNETKYLEYVLDTFSQKGLTDENIQDVLPYSKNLPKELYINNKTQ